MRRRKAGRITRRRTRRWQRSSPRPSEDGDRNDPGSTRQAVLRPQSLAAPAQVELALDPFLAVFTTPRGRQVLRRLQPYIDDLPGSDEISVVENPDFRIAFRERHATGSSEHVLTSHQVFDAVAL